jgi:SAM-dependent methyltransferase
MSDWGSGYVTDLEYSAGFYVSQTPGLLELTCLLFGLENSAAGEGFSYCELGCGAGVTSLILAASNPAGRFVAVDFNPAHVLQGRAAAFASGLTNIEFLERGFDELVDGGTVSLPEFDFITLHGVYSWVNREVRAAIVQILAKHLKPGGIVYVSYNAMPGWAGCVPIQRLLHEIALLGRERSDLKVLRAIGVMEKLTEVGAAALKENPFVREILRVARMSQQRYLAHEYLNDSWNPMFHRDVARELEAAKLSFVGSADLLSNFPQFMLSPEQREVVSGFEDPNLREMLIDFCVDRRFHEDVYIRGRRSMSLAKQERVLRRIKLALTVPRDKFKLKLKAHTGDADLSPDIYGPIADALAERPCCVGELVELAEVRTDRSVAPGEIVATLVGSHQAFPMKPDDSRIDQIAADRLNRVLLSQIEQLNPNNRIGLAVASLGSGIHCNFLEALLYNALLTGVNDAAEHVARDALRLIKAQGDRVVKDGQPIDDDAAALEELRIRVRAVTESSVPLWEEFQLLPRRLDRPQDGVVA